MIESKNQQEIPMEEIVSPLSPESYRDSTTQGKIISYFQTGDSEVLKDIQIFVYQFQVDNFNQGIMEGRITQTQIREMLSHVKSPIEGDGPEVEENIEGLVQRIACSSDERVILNFFAR